MLLDCIDKNEIGNVLEWKNLLKICVEYGIHAVESDL